MKSEREVISSDKGVSSLALSYIFAPFQENVLVIHLNLYPFFNRKKKVSRENKKP
jgi:hypothetical protein